MRESYGISGHVQRRPLTSPVRSDKARRTQKIAFLDGEQNVVNVQINILDNFIGSNLCIRQLCLPFNFKLFIFILLSVLTTNYPSILRLLLLQ